MRRRVGRAAGRALRPRPVLRLALPVLRLRGLRRRGGARAASAGRRRSSTALRSSWTCGPTRSTRAFGRRAAAARDASTSAAARRRCCPADVVAATARAWSARGSGSPPTPRSRSRPTRAPTSAATRRRSARAGVTRLSIGAQSLDAGGAAPARPAAPAGGRRRRRRRRRARPGIGSVSLDLLYDVPGPDARRLDRRRSTRRSRSSPDHLSLYALTLDDPDAEGLTAGGDHLPTTAGARRWRDARPRRPGRGPRRGAVPPRRRIASPRPASSGYEISNWARPGHESRHNLAYWQRRPYEAVGPGAHAFDGATRRWNAARLDGYLAALTPTDGGRPRLPPGGVEPIDAGDRGGRGASSSACGRDAGVPARRPRRAAARRRASAGPLAAELLDVTDGRPDRPDDPRPAALERALRAAASDARFAERSALALTLAGRDCYDAVQPR